MKKTVLFFSLFIISFFSFTLGVNAKINFTVSPIKYEIEALTGTTISKTATLYNYSENTYTIITGKSDFTTNGIDGVPKIVRKSELVYPDQQLSTWIEIETESFIIGPGEEKTINFTINIPNDATPGGHYGAVFFKKQGSEEGTSEIGINLDYGVLVLVNVDGEVITSGEPEEIIVNNNTVGGPSLTLDNCPFIDLSISNFDGKCIDDIFGPKQTEEINTDFEDIKFDIIFDIPFKNDGNTHIKPQGKITLIDEEGDELKQIGKEVIKNDKGAIIGEKIVDYLPVNDIGGNVLPNSKRTFQADWKGFPYKGYDDKGNEIIKYWDPGKYYTKQNVEDRGFLMFWERVCEKTEYKKITAIIDLSYKNKDGEDIEFSSAKEFEIAYKSNYIGINPYVIIPGIGFILLIVLTYIIILLRRQECKKCGKKFGRKYKACPYCGKKVKKEKK